MGARILRTELRRSAAVPAALLITVVGVLVLYTSGPAAGSWMELVTVQRDVMQMTWPLALAGGGWQGIRDGRSGVGELLATTSRSRRWRVLPAAAAMALTAAAGYLAMLAGAVGHLRGASYYPPAVLPVIALGALGMVAAVWLGLAAGAALPSPLTPPLLAVAGFTALAVLPPVLADNDQNRGYPGIVLLSPHLQGPRNFGYEVQRPSTGVELSTGLWLIGLAATGLALFAAARPATRAAALLPVLIGAAVAVPGLPATTAAAWVPDRHALGLVCTPDKPEVCVPRVRRQQLDRLRGPARQALAVLAAKLPGAPTRAVLRGPNAPAAERPPAGTLQIVNDSGGNQAPAKPSLAVSGPGGDPVWDMLQGGGVLACPQFEEDSRYAAARNVAAAWLLDRDLRPVAKVGETDEAPSALAALRALPPAEQRARVAALRDAELTCAPGDRLDLLTGRTR